jgi:hypothetical protein
MRKPKHFYNDTYLENFYFIPEWTPEQIRKYFGFEVTDKTGGSCWFTNNGVVIWVREFNIKSLDCLHHEAIHAANFVLNYKGVKSDNDNDEAHAYLSQWVFKRCMKYFRLKKN